MTNTTTKNKAASASNPWGSEKTQFFFSLTPDLVLSAIEDALGVRATGRTFTMNSMENRVYEIEIEDADSTKMIIAKFYRPGRWNEAQIEEEHRFLTQLAENEIPVIAPLPLSDGKTLGKMGSIYFAVFPKQGGRAPDELMGDDLEIVGRLLGRIHQVGRSEIANHRIRINPDSYGRQSLQYLLDNKGIALSYESAFRDVCEELFRIMDPRFDNMSIQRLHGDAHLGNLLHGRDGYFWVDFDDMVMGPPIQDMWLIIGDTDDPARWHRFLGGYETMCPFDHSSRSLVEPLRALRMIHFAGWMSKRWDDPAFPAAFPFFGSDRYWQQLVNDLKSQILRIQQTT